MNEKLPSEEDFEEKRKAKENSIPRKKFKEQVLIIKRLMVLIVEKNPVGELEKLKERQRRRERKALSQLFKWECGDVRGRGL